MVLVSLGRCWFKSGSVVQRTMTATQPYCSVMSSGRQRVNGVDLYYEQTGKGKHAVLLIPGALGSTRTDFGPQLKSLNKECFTVVCWDPCGYGQSRPPDRDFPPDFFERDAKDAVDLMKTLGFGNFSLLGWSDGGITALIAAATNPALIKKLVVWGSNAFVSQEDLKLYNSTSHFTVWDKCREAVYVYCSTFLLLMRVSFCTRLPFGDVQWCGTSPGGVHACGSPWRRFTALTVLLKRGRPGWMELHSLLKNQEVWKTGILYRFLKQNYFSQHCLFILYLFYLLFIGSICREQLPLISCPTLIVHGEKDPMVPSFHPQYLLKHIKGSRQENISELNNYMHLQLIICFSFLNVDCIPCQKENITSICGMLTSSTNWLKTF
uniref:Biphenyl hydrolase like n=1 Tax=Oryzias latipes TaxID=8090 RepID=A0A3P9H030_ORYLA